MLGIRIGPAKALVIGAPGFRRDGATDAERVSHAGVKEILVGAVSFNRPIYRTADGRGFSRRVSASPLDGSVGILQ